MRKVLDINVWYDLATEYQEWYLVVVQTLLKKYPAWSEDILGQS